MKHDYTITFETDNPLWERVLEIYNNNEKYPKKKVSGRNLHHKFPRSFSKKLGEEVDNDSDNLISLTPADHFLVHYYYYKLAKKGYRSAMALAFRMMARDKMKTISPETAEAIARDYEQAKLEIVVSEETKMKISEARKGMIRSVSTKRKISKAMKGKLKSEEHRRNLSEAKKGKKRSLFTEVTKLKMSESHKGKSSGVKGKKWWTDGVNNILVEICPEGFHSGRTINRNNIQE